MCLYQDQVLFLRAPLLLNLLFSCLHSIPCHRPWVSWFLPGVLHLRHQLCAAQHETQLSKTDLLNFDKNWVLVTEHWQINTRWFKYDRDDLCVNKSEFVPVIFEPPCKYTQNAEPAWPGRRWEDSIKMDLKRSGMGEAWTGSIWLRMGTGGGLLWMRYEHMGSIKCGEFLQ